MKCRCCCCCCSRISNVTLNLRPISFMHYKILFYFLFFKFLTQLFLFSCFILLEALYIIFSQLLSFFFYQIYINFVVIKLKSFKHSKVLLYIFDLKFMYKCFFGKIYIIFCFILINKKFFELVMYRKNKKVEVDFGFLLEDFMVQHILYGYFYLCMCCTGEKKKK